MNEKLKPVNEFKLLRKIFFDRSFNIRKSVYRQNPELVNRLQHLSLPGSLDLLWKQKQQ